MSEPSRFEKEIEELLARLGDWSPKDKPRGRFGDTLRQWIYRWQYGWQYALSKFRWSVPPEQLMLISILLILAAYFSRFVFPVVARYVAVLGFILFFTSFLFSFGLGQRRDRRWRGQVVNYRPGDFWDWLRRIIGWK